MNTRQRNSQAGLSLLELLAVITIIGIISAVVIPRIALSGATAKVNACWQNKAEINTAIERYFLSNSALPVDTSSIAAYFPDGIPVCPVSGSAYTLNATTKRVVLHTTGADKGGGDH